MTRGAATEQVRFVIAPHKTKPELANDQCELRRTFVLGQPALPGVPALQTLRYEFAARAKSAPVVFLEAPEAKRLPPALATLRGRLHHDTAAWQALNDIYLRVKRYPERLREVLLTDG